MKNILEYLENTAERMPQKAAFGNDKYELSFGEVQSSAKAVGSYLLSRGISRGSVAIFMDKSPAAVCAFFGVIYSGCFYACLDEKMPRVRIDAILESLSPAAVICDEKNEKTARALGIENTFLYTDIADFEVSESALDAVRRRQCDIDPIYVVFTSGSTGVPKGVIACHRSVIDYTETLSDALEFSSDTVFGNQTPLYFDAPLKEIMPTLKFGATTYFIPRMLFSFPVRMIDFLNEKRINTICWVVSALVQISALGALEKNKLEYINKVAFGSEVFPRREYDKWRAALPEARFYNLYGPTEATGMSCYWSADRELDESEPIPVGRPFDNTEIILLDEDNKEPEYGREGEICIRGTCLTMGYYNNPEKTDEVFTQNPLCRGYRELIYRTGDIGRYNSHGELVFVSRKDNQIKHMGHRIELGEIEAAALTSDAVVSSACVYDGGKKAIVLFYSGSISPSELKAILAERLPRYMLPAVIEQLDRIPLTDNGKIDRRTLRERALAISASEAE